MSKAELISDLQAQNQQWEGLLALIGEGRMDQPGVAGHWSIKDIVAHLMSWRRRTVARLQAAARGEQEPPPFWPASLQTDDEINAWFYEANHGRSVQEVLAGSRQVFEQLLAAIKALPEEALMDPKRFPWLGDQPLTATVLFAHFHEEHEPDMRAWLARQESHQQ
jgi:hypothetical protein